MLDRKENEEEDSLNSLRVASNMWPGLVYYQGITPRTTLTTSEKATQTQVKPGSLKKRSSPKKAATAASSHSHTTKPSLTAADSDAENDGQKENEAGGKDIDASLSEDAESLKTSDSLHSKQTRPDRAVTKLTREDTTSPAIKRPQTTPAIRRVHHLAPSAASTSNESVRLFRKREKLLFPLPHVSWNELSRLEDGPPGELLSFTSETNPTLLQSINANRPHTARPRVLVPPRHSGPVGLNQEDVIRGRRLLSDNSPSGQQLGCHQPDGLQTDEVTKPLLKRHTVVVGLKTSTKDDINNSNHTSNSSSNTRPLAKLSRPGSREDPADDTTSLKLTITSIQPETATTMTSRDATTDENGCGDSNPLQHGERKDNSNNNIIPRTHENSTPFSCYQSTNFNTIEGIRRSYRRAQSAPPSNEHSKRMHSCYDHKTDTTSGDTKRFSNLYWRAKSAYHKRSESDDPDENVKTDYKAQSSKHTLLRPLLRVDSDIKHSKGCPNNCRGCFKACLVSDDYVKNAIKKAVSLDATTAENTQKKSKGSSHDNNTNIAPIRHHTNVVKAALARSQPLFHQVYGRENITRRRLNIQPWPVYGWRDSKNKTEKEKECDML